VLPRSRERLDPAGHKALLHCRIRCRSRCCHRGRPDPSLGLRTDKTFRRFAGAKRRFGAHLRLCLRRSWASAPKRSVSGPIFTAIQRRAAEATRSEPARDRRPGAEAPGSGQRRPTRRRIFGGERLLHRERVAEATAELPMPSRRFRRAPERIYKARKPESAEIRGPGRPSVERTDLRAPRSRSFGTPLSRGTPKRTWSRSSCGRGHSTLTSMGIDEGRAARCRGRSRTGEVR